MGLLSEGMVLEEVQVGNGRERNGIMGFRMKGTGGIKAVVSRWGEEGQGGAGEGIVALLATNVGQVLGCGHQLMQYGTKYTLPLCINQIQKWNGHVMASYDKIPKGGNREGNFKSHRRVSPFYCYFWKEISSA